MSVNCPDVVSPLTYPSFGTAEDGPNASSAIRGGLTCLRRVAAWIFRLSVASAAVGTENGGFENGYAGWAASGHQDSSSDLHPCNGARRPLFPAPREFCTV
jgi:hypothetical protein